MEVYQAPIAELGYLTTAAPLANAAVCLGAGLFSDRHVWRHGWRTLEARRMMQGIGTLVPGLCMVGLAHARGAWEAAAVVTVWMAATMVIKAISARFLRLRTARFDTCDL